MANQTYSLRDFITNSGERASLFDLIMNNNQAINGYLAKQAIPQSFTAIIDPSTMLGQFTTNGGATLGGTIGYVNTSQAMISSNAPASYAQFADSNTNQGIVLSTAGLTTQALAYSQPLIGSQILATGYNVANFDQFGYTFNLYSLGTGSPPRINDSPVQGAQMIFQFCDQPVHDSTGKTTSMSDCVNMEVGTQNIGVFPYSQSFPSTFTTQNGANIPMSSLYSVSNPQTLNVKFDTTRAQNYQDISLINQQYNSTNSPNYNPFASDMYVSTYTTHTIPVQDIKNLLNSTYSNNCAAGCDIELNKIAMENYTPNSLMILSNVQLGKKNTSTSNLYTTARLKIFQQTYPDASTLLGTGVTPTESVIQSALQTEANILVTTTTNFNSGSAADNWVVQDRANDIYNTIGIRDIRGYAYGVFKVEQLDSSGNVVTDSIGNPVQQLMFLGAVSENTIKQSAMELQTPLTYNQMSNILNQNTNTQPQYPEVYIYYDELYMEAKDPNGNKMDLEAIRKMLNELVTKLNAFGVQTQVVNADKLASIMSSQDSKITTNSRIIITGPLPDTLFPLQSNNGQYSDSMTEETALMTKNLLRQYITNGGQVIQLQGNNQYYLNYLKPSTITVGTQTNDIITPTLGNFFDTSLNPLALGSATQNYIGLPQLLGLSAEWGPYNLYGTTVQTMNYANSSNVLPTVTNYPSTGIDYSVFASQTNRLVYKISENSTGNNGDAVLLISSAYPTSTDISKAGVDGTGTYMSMNSVASYANSDAATVNALNAIAMADNVYTVMTSQIIDLKQQTISMSQSIPATANPEANVSSIGNWNIVNPTIPPASSCTSNCNSQFSYSLANVGSIVNGSN